MILRLCKGVWCEKVRICGFLIAYIFEGRLFIKINIKVGVTFKRSNSLISRIKIKATFLRSWPNFSTVLFKDLGRPFSRSSEFLFFTHTFLNFWSAHLQDYTKLFLNQGNHSQLNIKGSLFNFFRLSNFHFFTIILSTFY